MTTRTQETAAQKPPLPQPDQREYRTPKDPALIHAWQLYFSYDAAANRQKFWHIRLRSSIIVGGLLTSTLAIGSALPILGDVFNMFSELVKLLLILLPITIAGMMTFASQFTPSLAWIIYRIAAETIRREIYLYRMKAGDYADDKEPDIAKKQFKLIANVEKANAEVDQLNTVIPFLQPLSLDSSLLRERIKTLRLTDTAEDDGFTPLTGMQYIEWRIVPQRNWYVRKVMGDYKNLRLSRVYMIAIAGMGTLLAALGGGLEHYVVITTAAGLAASTYVQVQMFGQTYIGYHLTAKKMDIELANWMMMTPQQKEDEIEAARLVYKMEDIFQDERMMWMQVSIQAQTSGEQALIKNIGEWTNTRFGLALPGEQANGDQQPGATLIPFTPTSSQEKPTDERKSKGSASSG